MRLAYCTYILETSTFGILPIIVKTAPTKRFSKMLTTHRPGLNKDKQYQLGRLQLPYIHSNKNVMSLHFLSYLPENSSEANSPLCCLLKIPRRKYTVMKKKPKSGMQKTFPTRTTIYHLAFLKLLSTVYKVAAVSCQSLPQLPSKHHSTSAVPSYA